MKTNKVSFDAKQAKRTTCSLDAIHRITNHLGLMLLALVLVAPACTKKDQERHERKSRHERREHHHVRNPQCRGDNALHDRKCIGTNEGAVKEHHKRAKHHENKKNHTAKKHEHKHMHEKHHAHHAMKEEVVVIDEEPMDDEEMMGS